MSEEDAGGAKFAKGDRAAILSGRNAGVRGSVFWVGPNKFGEGMRYGLRDDHGTTHWVDGAELGAEADAPPPPEVPPKPPLDKGARVRITGGRDAGKTGEVFWVGESRYGPGMRYGVRGPGEDETYWVDEAQVELDESAPSSAPAPAARDDSAAFRDAANEFVDDPEAGFGGDGGSGSAEAPPAFEDSWPEDDDFVPSGDDDLPF